MSREDVRLEGYQPGNGFQPADFGFSLRDVLTALVFGLVGIAVREFIRKFFGYDTHSLAGFVVLGWFIVREFRAKLDAERLKEAVAEEDARRVRNWGVVSIILDAVIAILAIGSLLFLAERW